MSNSPSSISVPSQEPTQELNSQPEQTPAGAILKIHKYDVAYASRHGWDETKIGLTALFAIVSAVMLGVASLFLCIYGVNSWGFEPAPAVITVAVLWLILFAVIMFFNLKNQIFAKAQCSVLLETSGKLYYMQINSMRSETPAEAMTAASNPADRNKILRSISFSPEDHTISDSVRYTQVSKAMAQDDDIIRQLFTSFQAGQITASLGTVLFGKPAYVYEILDPDFGKISQKSYRVRCLKPNGHRGWRIIPNVFPTFFGTEPPKNTQTPS